MFQIMLLFEHSFRDTLITVKTFGLRAYLRTEVVTTAEQLIRWHRLRGIKNCQLFPMSTISAFKGKVQME